MWPARRARGGDEGVTVGLGLTTGLGLGIGSDDPAGVGLAGVPTHAAMRTPRRRDATRCLAFICRRRWCCGLSRR